MKSVPAMTAAAIAATGRTTFRFILISCADAGPNASVLDGQGTYVTFGKVTDGLDVVKNILALAGSDGQTPTKPVTVNSIVITES